MDRRKAVMNLTEFVVNSENACASETPFYHLEFDRVFPDDLYAAMMREMQSGDYRALPGRDNGNIMDDGTATRVKIDCPECIRNLPANKRGLGHGWRASPNEGDAFPRRLAPRRTLLAPATGISACFDPILTRDVPTIKSFRTPTQGKGITVQFYLPPDDSPSTSARSSMRGAGRQHARSSDAVPAQQRLRLAVGSDTWHSADLVSPR
jgi:hypothetical protein